MSLADRNVLYASTNHAWSYGWTFYQLLAEALARLNDVVYVDTPTSVARGLARTRAVPTSSPRLRVLQSPGVPLQRNDALRRLAAAVTARNVERWARREGFRPDLLWTYAPYELALAERFRDAHLVYWTGDEVVMPREDELLRRADTVLCVSRPVHERHAARLGAKARFVPVAADVDRYAAARALPPDPEVASLPRPVYGYSGFVNHRLDFDLLRALAAAVPRGTVAVVGPRSLDPVTEGELASLPNVHLLGPQPSTRVPAVMRAFDVGLMPYLDNDFNRNANPAKFYEYLAADLPVVTIDIPTLRPFAHVASIGDSASFVERALAEAESPTGTTGERELVARAHSFDALLERLEEIPL